MSASLVLLRAGWYTTVQDGGRWGHQHLGVPVGGALDLLSLREANALVGNDLLEAALEVTLVGCELRAVGEVTMAVAGARFVTTVDGEPVTTDRPLTLRDGQTLALGERRLGARAYVAVRGGIDVPRVLGSRGAWPMHPRRGALRDGTRLVVGTRIAGPPRARPLPPRVVRESLRVLPTAEVEGTTALDALLHGAFRVASSASRMAYPLDGPPVRLIVPDRPSSGTVGGALQILPSGQPVLLLADRQTTGGYPVAGVVATADLPHAAQLAPGDPVRFVRCSRAEALRALMEEARWFDA